MSMALYLSTPRDVVNAFTRDPCKRDRTLVYHLPVKTPVNVNGRSDNHPRTAVEIQLRWVLTPDDLENAPWHE